MDDDANQIVLHQSIGFSFRYRANITRKVPGLDKRYSDTEEQTLEVEGKGYSSLEQAINASVEAKDKVIEILSEPMEPEEEQDKEPEEGEGNAEPDDKPE